VHYTLLNVTVLTDSVCKMLFDRRLPSLETVPLNAKNRFD